MSAGHGRSGARVPDPAEEPLKICRVIARLNVGGPAVHLTQLTAGLHTRFPQRFEQRLVAGLESPGEASMVPLARERGVEPIVIPHLGREIDPSDDASALLALYRLFRAWRPTIVETHTAKAGTLGRVAALAARVPIRVHVFHGHVLRGYFGPAKTRAFLELERALARITTRIVALGESQRTELLSLGIGEPGKVVAIPLGFELRPFLEATRRSLRQVLGLTAGARLVGILGRLAPIKRHDVFLRAARLIADGEPDAHFVVIGDGETRGEVERLAAELRITERLHLLGWRAHAALPSLLADLDLLVNTSDNEGMPTSLIEAMAAGVPVVATRVGGTVSLIVDGVTGRLVTPGEPGELAGAALTLLRDGAMRVSMADAARAAVHPRYDASTLIETMNGFYTSLVEGNR
jgi:glycosyltransferase involved in cell wall biosynthesis